MPEVSIKTPEAIEKMRVAGRLAAEVLEMITPHVVPGVTSNQLNDLCHDFMVNVQKTIPAPLNYGHPPFPKSICASPNYVICHGIPNDKPLKKGDILNLDITIIKDSYHGDTSKMFMVGGETSILGKRLMNICYEALWRGIREVKPGAHLGDIGFVIQHYTEAQGFSVVRDYCGHGIGTGFHEEPQVLHYGKRGEGLELKAGMTFTIEPMINAGKKDAKVLPDHWTVVTKDHSLSAQWEHTILVTPTGFEVLTLRQEEQDRNAAA